MSSIRNQLFTSLDIAYRQVVQSLARAVGAKDRDTADHGYRLADLAVRIGRDMHLSERQLRDLRYGAILHDIGKIGIPDSVLKKPSQLNENEWSEIRQHPLIGAEILAAIPHFAGVARIVLYHHEHFDGGGYPLGLKGNAIPLAARILAVVDAYGAIVEERVYKSARSHEAAIAELMRCSGTQFDPDVLRSFVRLAKKPRYARRLILEEENAPRKLLRAR